MKFGSITTSIIADGLIVNIDSANRSSYPRTGTTTYNTLDSSDTGTMNGVTFEDEEFNFDGADDYINFGNLSIGNFGDQVPFTFNVWCKLNDGSPLNLSSDIYAVFSKYLTNNVNGGYALLLRGGTTNGIAFRSTYSGSLGNGLDLSPPIDMSSTFTDYEYHSVSITYDSSRLISMYIDGQFINSKTLGTGQSHYNSKNFYLGVYSSTLNLDFPGNIGPLQIYNRTLSANEVLHNHNALKGRFE